MIRKATTKDLEGIWEIFKAVISSGDTYVFDPQTPREHLEKLWLSKEMQTFVFESETSIVGTYMLKPNHIDLGSHIVNAGYMVHPNAQRQGIGRKLCEHSLKTARELGFVGMQFNIVVSSNQPAITLWKKLGFEIVGTAPKAFKHAQQGIIDAYIMYRDL